MSSTIDNFVNYASKYSSELMLIYFFFIVIVAILFVWVWRSNRRRYQMLKHQIPAKVVKGYLDAVIQNSNSLKSSLFRGGGLDADVSAVPSVLALTDLPGGSQVGIDDSDAASLKARISSLEASLAEKQQIISQLEDLKAQHEGEIKQKEARIAELEALLKEAQANQGSGEDVDTSEFEKTIANQKDEIQDLKEQLQEYEVIAADIANMKKLKDENEQLRRALEEKGGAAPVAEEAVVEEEAPAEEVAAKEQVEEPASEEVKEEASVEEAPAEEVVKDEASSEEGAEEVKAAEGEEGEATEAGQKDEKSPEDLLSEFEKMLG